MKGMLDHIPVVGSYSSTFDSSIPFLSSPPTTMIFPFNTAAAHPFRAHLIRQKRITIFVMGGCSSPLCPLQWSAFPSMNTACPFNTAAAHRLRASFMEGKADHCPDVVSYCSADESGSPAGVHVVVVGYDGCKANNPTTCQWSSIPSMQTERRDCAAVGVGGTLYVIGGLNLSSMSRYNCLLPSSKDSIISCLDALEEAAGLENDSSAFKKRVESLEMKVFGYMQET